MKKILTAQVLTGVGIATYAGLYDNNGNPVTIELEKDSGGVSMTILYEASDENCDHTEEKIQEICSEHDDCEDCPMREYCEYGDEREYGDAEI